MSQKRILVTGGAGYIGSHFVRRLSEEGYAVDVVDNLSTGYRENLCHKERLFHVDLSDLNSLDSLLSAETYDGIVHFAASIVVPESLDQPLEYYWNNTANLIQVLKLCQKHNIQRFVFSSTAAVYGETSATGLISEQVPAAPTNPYGFSKLMSEQVLQDFARANPSFRFAILRYFNVAGADPKCRMGQRNPKSTHLIKIACEVAVGRRDFMNVFGTDYDTPDGTCIRDYIHVEDLAAIHLHALKHIEHSSLKLNCGYGCGHSVLEVIETLKAECNVDFEVRTAPRRAGDVPKLVADPTLLRKTLDWKPQFESLSTIIKDAYNWEKSLIKVAK